MLYRQITQCRSPMCVMARWVTQHTEMILHTSEMVKHVSRENQNKSSYISTMIIHVDTAETPKNDAVNYVKNTVKMYE